MCANIRKQGSGEVLTKITTFINPHMYGRHHISKMIDYAVITVMDDSKIKPVNGYEQGSHDVMQSSHGNSVYSIRSSF